LWQREEKKKGRTPAGRHSWLAIPIFDSQAARRRGTSIGLLAGDVGKRKGEKTKKKREKLFACRSGVDKSAPVKPPAPKRRNVPQS